jgi:hypothetical protein
MRGSVWLVSAIVCAGVVATYASGCGSDGDDSKFGEGAGDSGTGPGLGNVDAQADGNPANGVDTCGGKPCANHTGSKDFGEQGAPPNAGALFGGAASQPNGTDPAQEPGIIYPNHETMFPLNVTHIRHAWTGGGPTNDLFRLTFKGPKTTVVVYTINKEWEPSEEEWDWIAESNRGNAVTFEIAALSQATPAKAWQSKTITFEYSANEVEGALYYWSTGSKGIMKALVSDRIPEKFYPDPKSPDADTCAACHTLSRDGKRLAVDYGGEKLREVNVPPRATIVPNATSGEYKAAWTTFSPDGTKLLIAEGGVLTLIDSDTGARIGPNNGVIPLPAGQKGTHPDWSALGDRVVFTMSPKAGNKSTDTGSVAILPYNNGAWGTPQVIVQSASPADNNFFPVFSPDSKWIAYVNAQGGSKDAVSARLRLIPSTGGAPTELVRLNGRVNNADSVTGIGNSMPTWAPATKPGVFWLAFSSLRAYSNLRPQDGKLDQIWIAAIDPSKPDPAYSAFWAPFQSMPEGNHRAFWTHVEGDKQCRCVEICGDGIDNNCNGVADEADCQVCGPVDIPGNGKDDNCDCVIDNPPAEGDPTCVGDPTCGVH